MAEYTIITEQDRMGYWSYTIRNDQGDYIDADGGYPYRFRALQEARAVLRTYLRPPTRKRKEHKYRG